MRPPASRYLQVASGSTNEAPPPAVPFAGEGRDEFPGRAYPIPVVKALEGRVRVVGDPMSHGGDHGAYGDTGLGHGEWGRRSVRQERVLSGSTFDGWLLCSRRAHSLRGRQSLMA